MVETNNKRVAKNTVNVLFSALTPANKNITFAASTLKQKSYAERKSQLSGGLQSVSAVQWDKESEGVLLRVWCQL